MYPVNPSESQSHQNPYAQKHCILVAASNTPLYCPPTTGSEQNENSEVQMETCLADAETVAKLFRLVICEFKHLC